MLLSMTRVQIIGTKPHLDQTVRLLHRLGVIQVDPWAENRGLPQPQLVLSQEAAAWRERLAFVSARVDSLLAVLPGSPAFASTEYDLHYAQPTDWLLAAVEADLAQVEPETRLLTKRHDELEEQLDSLTRYEVTLRQLLPVIPGMVDLERYAVTAIWLETRYQALLEPITRQLESLTEGRCEIITQPVSQDRVVAVLVFPKEQARAIGDLLGQENVFQLRLPPNLAGQPFDQALANMRRQLQTIPHELAEIETRQKELTQKWGSGLLSWQALLRDHLAQFDVCTNFGQTDYTFIIAGWIPERRLAELQTALADEVGEEVLVIPLPLSPAEKKESPVLFNNPLLVKPFEPLVGLLAWPRYGDIDPTPLMALFFPLFFGMMLGDVAYGFILLALLLYFRPRFQANPILCSLSKVLIMGAIWSIIFGFLFGEFLGTLGETVGLHPLWFNRGENIQALFLFTIGLGAGHIVLGLCLGVWQGWLNRSRHEIMERASMLAALAALFLLVAIFTDYLPDSFFTPAMALLLVGLVILIYSLGKLGLLLGPLELLGTLSNILSYLRIAAIGLSSVYLAQVGNELGGMTGNLLVGVIIATLFHALTLVMGTFSPTIQSLRLHYVEFFSKFYQGGGQPFRPFQRSRIADSK